MNEAQIQTLLEDYFIAEELEDCFVVEIKIKRPLISVFVDSDEDLGFDKCTRISRYLESIFDEGKHFGEKYTLEVSSPGIGKPLKFKRQYIKNIGRKVEVRLLGGNKSVIGLLKEVNENELKIERDVVEKQGKKKIKKKLLVSIADQDIENIIVKVSF